MFNSYTDFIKKIKDKSIMFCGLGKSNLPFIEMLTNEKINITAYDGKKIENLPKNVATTLKNNPCVKLRAGDESIWDEYFDIIIRTPGISFFSKKISEARSKGSVVTSEMEIFFDICPCPIIGVTGSDGKTTTTTIISEILKESGKKVYLGGNIGKPLLPRINEINKNDIAVVELSSFQLMSFGRSPERAVVSNISVNHLDFHRDMNEYIECKKQIILHQNAFSRAILNFDNPETQKMSKCVRGKTVFFSSCQKLNAGVWIDSNKNIIFSENQKNSPIINISDIKLPGQHNIENYLAAIACTADLVKAENIKKVAQTFLGVEHRLEFVKTLHGVSYYNDSIASTPNRTISGALSLFDEKIILIAGGYDKKTPFDLLAKKINEKVSVVILMGNSADTIQKEILKFKKHNSNSPKIIMVKTMEDAVREARSHANNKDIVVLSPACASFDLYSNFEERGTHFKSLVKSLI